MPCGAFVIPLPVAVEAVEVIDPHNFDTFGGGHIKGLSHVFEGAEGVRCVQMGVNVDYRFHIHEYSLLKVSNNLIKVILQCGFLKPFGQI